MAINTFTSGINTSFSTELNSNFSELLTTTGTNTIRQLIDRAGIWSAGGIEGWGDAYIDANGRENSVVVATATATFDTNKYKCLKETTDSYTTHDPDGVTNPSNAFDGSSTTYASESQGSGYLTSNLGKTFGSAKLVTNVRVKASCTATDNNLLGINIKLQTYNGSTWSDVATLDSDSQSGTASASYDSTYALNSSVQGVRVQANTASGSGSQSNAFYLIEVFETVQTLVYHDIPSGTFNSGVSSSFGTPLITDFETGASVEYKLTNAGGNDSGWLNSNEISSFTSFTAEPDTLIVQLTPKSSSPTSAYPSIRGFWVKAS